MERRKGDAADSVPEQTDVRNGFSNEPMYGQNTEKKRLVRYGRLNDVRRKCGGTNGREPGRIESVKKRTEGGRGKERRFTQQFLNKYFSSNRERNKERKRRKEEAEDRNARYGRRTERFGSSVPLHKKR